MKFENNYSDVKTIGDIKNNSVGIDVKNIEFITTILSSNLYSNPIDSLIRENVSNAWDSHIEAGNSNPIILEFFDNLDEETVGFRIIDFGTGISSERFNEVYKFIGSSTKRDNNQQIGGFGLGKFSTLSYTNNVHIISRYNGKKYTYLMYKNGNSLYIDNVLEEDTDEHNGVTIEINIKKTDLLSFSKSILRQLEFFENVFVKDSLKDSKGSISYYDTIQSNIENFNRLKIKDFKTFKINNIEHEYYKENSLRILLGKIVYPLNTKYFEKFKVSFDFNCALKFDIGDLEVTPNREEIIYNEKTIDNINKKLNEFENEIDSFNDKTKNYTIPEIIEKKIYNGYNTIYRFSNGKDFRVKFLNEFTVEGVKVFFKDFYNIIVNLFQKRGIKTVDIDKYSKRKNFYLDHISFNSLLDKFLNGSEMYLLSKDLNDLKRITKSYIKENLINDIVERKKILLCNLNKDSLNEEVKIVKNKFKDQEFLYPIIDYIKNYFENLINNLPTFNDDSVPEDYIKSIKKTKKERIVYDESTISVDLYKESKKKDNIIIIKKDRFELDYLSNLKGTIICGIKNEDDEKLKELVKFLTSGYSAYYKIKDLFVFSVVRKNIEKIKNLNNENIMIFNEMLEKPEDYDLIRKIGTAMYIDKKMPELYNLKNSLLLPHLSTDLNKKVQTLYTYCEKYSSIGYSNLANNLAKEIYNLCIKKDAWDKEMKDLFDNNERELKNSTFLLSFKNNTSYSDFGYLVYLVDYIKSKNIFKLDDNVLEKYENILDKLFN